MIVGTTFAFLCSGLTEIQAEVINDMASPYVVFVLAEGPRVNPLWQI